MSGELSDLTLTRPARAYGAPVDPDIAASSVPPGTSDPTAAIVRHLGFIGSLLGLHVGNQERPV